MTRSTDPNSCPACGARRVSSAAVPCWLCGETLPAQLGPAKPAVATSTETGLLIVVGVMAVLVGVAFILEAPGVGIVLAVLMIPALGRAALVSWRGGGSLDTRQTVLLFVTSLCAVVTVGVATIVAFFIACFAVGCGTFALSGGHGDALPIIAGIGMGLVAAITVLIWLCRKFWPR